MPFSCCSEARFIASLIAFTSVWREATILRSITATVGAGGEMRGGFRLGAEDAGAFQRDIDAEVFPGQCGGIAVRGDLDLAVAEADRIAVDGHGAGEAAMHRIEA